jgi:chromate transport protein ChrA
VVSLTDYDGATGIGESKLFLEEAVMAYSWISEKTFVNMVHVAASTAKPDNISIIRYFTRDKQSL